MRAAIVLFSCAIAVAGCATGTASDDSSSSDSGSPKDATVDGPRDGGSSNCPTGYTGANCQSCAGGFHSCGTTTCKQDNANTPDAGCTLGCGTACDAPQNATAKCTSDGHCDFACQTSFDKVDGGCVCPPGQMVCGSVCQECCVDSDCVGHQTCVGGACSGCQAGWGDCNKNASDGCEVHLNSTSNCGSCGHSCCSSFCGCGFLGVSGENCNASGNSFSCGC